MDQKQCADEVFKYVHRDPRVKKLAKAEHQFLVSVQEAERDNLGIQFEIYTYNDDNLQNLTIRELWGRQAVMKASGMHNCDAGATYGHTYQYVPFAEENVYMATACTEDPKLQEDMRNYNICGYLGTHILFIWNDVAAVCS